jgi:hypothetical protein
MVSDLGNHLKPLLLQRHFRHPSLQGTRVESLSVNADRRIGRRNRTAALTMSSGRLHAPELLLRHLPCGVHCGRPCQCRAGNVMAMHVIGTGSLAKQPCAACLHSLSIALHASASPVGHHSNSAFVSRASAQATAKGVSRPWQSIAIAGGACVPIPRKSCQPAAAATAVMAHGQMPSPQADAKTHCGSPYAHFIVAQPARHH